MLEKEMTKVSGAQKTGYKIVRKALEAPLRQIAENSGVEPTGIITYIQNGGTHAGYDFTKYDEADQAAGQEPDMMKAGIVDPLKVTRLALENAVSIASTLVTTEAIVVDKPEPKAPAAPGGMGGATRMYDPSEALHDRVRRGAMNIAFVLIMLLNVAQLRRVGVRGWEWLSVLFLIVAATPLVDRRQKF